jgi:hypothetical protein
MLRALLQCVKLRILRRVGIGKGRHPAKPGSGLPLLGKVACSG